MSASDLARPDASALRRHGGRLGAAMRRWPDAPRPWIDLSTGMNPHPYPAPRATAAARARLPDPDDLAELETVAALAFGADADRVCATAGAEAALRLLPHVLGARSAAILGPTYGGHAEAWCAFGIEPLIGARPAVLAEAANLTAEVLVLVNPNNPDGTRTSAAEVLALADQLTRAGRRLVVDESFVEVTPGLSVAGRAGVGLVVLRSFGKAYGLAGLRLGFLLADPDLLARVRARQGDWPVAADALAAGRAAYADPAWLERTRLRLRRDADRLDALLRRAGYDDLRGSPLFRYARVADAADRLERLGRRGVLVRPFDHAPDRLRFGLPPRGAWRRLETALMETA